MASHTHNLRPNKRRLEQAAHTHGVIMASHNTHNLRPTKRRLEEASRPRPIPKRRATNAPAAKTAATYTPVTTAPLTRASKKPAGSVSSSKALATTLQHTAHSRTSATIPSHMLLNTTTRPLVCDPAWTEGNFQVVTSDGVEFRMPDYLLFWASSVFADAHSLLTSEKRVEFMDRTFETAAVFRGFLQLVTTLKCEDPPTVSELPDDAVEILYKTNLLLFLRKWGCEPLYSIVLDDVYRMIKTTYTVPLHFFQLASQLGETTLCVDILQCAAPSAWPHRWHSAAGDPWSAALERRCPFDPDGWSPHFWREHDIPPDYLFAVMKAFKAARCNSDGSKDIHDLGTKFKTALKDAKHCLVEGASS